VQGKVKQQQAKIRLLSFNLAGDLTSDLAGDLTSDVPANWTVEGGVRSRFSPPNVGSINRIMVER
jgi:hypothetical protein